MKTTQVLNEFFDERPTITFAKKQIVLSPEDDTGCFYYIVRGYVRSYSITEWGDEKLGVIYKSDEMFPLIWIFDQKALTRYYEAMTEVKVKKCRVSEFISFTEKRPEVLFDLAQKAATILEVFSDRIDCLEYTKAYARVISLLLHYVRRFGRKEKDGGVLIQVPISHKDIANGVAVARETVTRELMKLEKKGLISTNNHHVKILDPQKLENELSSFYSKKLL
ncbi:MAG: Crp/Fnr family transcriptional regulator [Patescibacteria group bacterium]